MVGMRERVRFPDLGPATGTLHMWEQQPNSDFGIPTFGLLLRLAAPWTFDPPYILNAPPPPFIDTFRPAHTIIQHHVKVSIITS